MSSRSLASGVALLLFAVTLWGLSGVAVGLAFLGCALAARVYDPAGLRLDLLGVLLGLASGLCWALWNVFGKQVLETQHPLTVALYGTLGSTLLLVPLQPSLLPTTVP